MSKIKVGIAEDQEIFRKALSHLLNQFNRVEVITEAENGKALLESKEVEVLDIAILD